MENNKSDPYPQNYPQPQPGPQPGLEQQPQPSLQQQPYLQPQQYPQQQPYSQPQPNLQRQPSPQQQQYPQQQLHPQQQPYLQPQQPYLQPQQPSPYPQHYPQTQPPNPYPQQYGYAPYQQKQDPAAVYTKRLRKVVMRIVLAMTGFYAANLGISIAVMIVYLVASGVLGNMISLAATNPEASTQSLAWALTEELPLGLISILGIIAGAFLLLIVRGIRPLVKDLVRVNGRVRVPDLGLMMGLILGFNAVATLVPVLLDMLLKTIGLSLPSDGLDEAFYEYLSVSGILYVVILGPIFEEIIFRGAILHALKPFGENFAIVLSSLLFGVYHLVFLQGIFAFFVGLVLAYCALRYSIKWAMLLHMLNNGLSMLLLYFQPGLPVEMGVYVLFLVAAIPALLFGRERLRQQTRNGRPMVGMDYQPQGMPAPAGGYAPQQTVVGNYTAAGNPGYQPLPVVVKPFVIAFSSPWLIVALTLAGLFILAGLLGIFVPGFG